MNKVICILIVILQTASSLLLLACNKMQFIPNEDDSSSYICAIHEGEYDYYLSQQDIGQLYCANGKREASVGTAMDGMYYDGENAYRYPGGKMMDAFPFEEYDCYVDGLRRIAQQIIADKLYESYNDHNKEWISTNYYFKITEDGLSLFNDGNYSSGLIVCYYRNQQFNCFKLLLYRAEDSRAHLSCDIGHITYSVLITPPE